MSAAKAFDDAAVYQAEIRALVPGYDDVHARLPGMVSMALGHVPASVAVVGCGPGHELLALAMKFEDAQIVGLDPAPAMVASARAAIDAAGLESRVRVLQDAVPTPTSYVPCEAVVVALVGHFIPDDGHRAAYYEGLCRLLKPGGVLANVELGHRGPADDAAVTSHVAHARAAGLSPSRCDALRTRLSDRFHRLTQQRREALMRASSLTRIATPQVHHTVVTELYRRDDLTQQASVRAR